MLIIVVIQPVLELFCVGKSPSLSLWLLGKLVLLALGYFEFLLLQVVQLPVVVVQEVVLLFRQLLGEARVRYDFFLLGAARACGHRTHAEASVLPRQLRGWTLTLGLRVLLAEL